MKIDFRTDDGRGRTALIARAEADDAVPSFDRLLMDAAPCEIDYERVAVAACLLFGGGSGDSIEFGWAIGQRLADAISASSGLRVRSTIVEPVDPTEAIQATSLQVSFGLPSSAETPPMDQARLSLVPGERFYGGLHGIKESVIGSNAWLIADYVSEAYVSAAVGALYSRDFLASTVLISGHEVISTSALKVIRDLYSSVDLGLEFAGGQ
jgi:hypothetical protein